MSVKQPITQVRLTNIAVVRYRTKGNRYEIACFPNKVMDWRKKIEKDIGRVLQSDSIFKNVSKGQFASNKELLEDFGTTNTIDICLIILEKGQLQVSEKERSIDLANKLKEVVLLVTSMCVNSDTKQPVPVRMIENATAEIKFNVNTHTPVKQQALRLFRQLVDILPIERVKMKVCVVAPIKHTRHVKTIVNTHASTVLSITQNHQDIEFVLLIDPGTYKPMTEEFSTGFNGEVDVSVLEVQADVDDMGGVEGVELEMDESEDEIKTLPDSEETGGKKKKGRRAKKTDENDDIVSSMAGLTLEEQGEGEKEVKGKKKLRRKIKKSESDEELEAAMALLNQLPSGRRNNKTNETNDDVDWSLKGNKRKNRRNNKINQFDGEDSDSENESDNDQNKEVQPTQTSIVTGPGVASKKTKNCSNNVCGGECMCDAWGSTDDDISNILNRFESNPVILKDEEDVYLPNATIINKSVNTDNKSVNTDNMSGSRSKTSKYNDDDDDDILAILNRNDKVKVLREDEDYTDSVMLIHTNSINNSATNSQFNEDFPTKPVASLYNSTSHQDTYYIDEEEDEENGDMVISSGGRVVKFMQYDDDDYDDEMPLFAADMDTIMTVQRAGQHMVKYVEYEEE